MRPNLHRTGVVAPTLSLLALVFTLAVDPRVAHATSPDPRYSTIDLVVVGNSSGSLMTESSGNAPGYDVTVRDVNNTPVPGHVVVLDFSNSAMKLYAVQNAGTTLDCALRRLSQVTNGAGAVKFAARLGGYDNTNAIEIVHEGVVLGIVKGRSTDLDGADGTTGLGDFALFAANFLNNQAAPETDFDLGGSTGLGDFSLLSAEFLRNTTSAYCP